MGDMKKIHIIGSVGSGKTTLASKLSDRLRIPFYELDNVVWNRKEPVDIRRTEQERAQYLNKITTEDRWIIEGVHNEWWVEESFLKADIIIFLDTFYSVRTYRIIKRFLFQKLRLETSNYDPTIRIFFKMFKWNKYFEKNGKPNFFREHENVHGKVVKVNGERELYRKIPELQKGQE